MQMESSNLNNTTDVNVMADRKVPEISLLSYVKGTGADKVDFVDKLFTGLKDYGFVILSDHTVEQKKVDDAYNFVHEFFNLPIEEKLKYSGVDGGQRGYTPFKKEHAKNSKHPDLKEFWHVGRDLDSSSQYNSVYPKNIWPTEIPEFQNVFTELYKSMDVTSNILLEAIGKALDVPSDYFSKMIHDGNSILRTIHYPPLAKGEIGSSVRAAAHEDINLITLLVGATSSGLELLDRDGSWLSVDSKPGQIVVDTGDMMSVVTNGLLPATTHRVVNPDGADMSTSRYSMPFFVHPHSNAMLDPLEQCLSGGRKYDAISAGDFLQQRLREIGLI